ncbi:2-dehydropantoate 2-reductase [Sulfitobacter noctilucae]|uniref:2-dehydropantoate 2-reductase n=1 Tax=Sulfitobacter noctilucae TaxID=1342302 RepID=UPI00046824E0|nr:2-dehydropantoate 2-reductase [Sulfitobacter noctilucae]KIN70932.1 2-dehydropantoate 2-reductase [Sulfitobacter noctilucae]
MAADAPHIVVAGAGAIGCFVGGLLAASGARVSLLVRPRIAAEVRAHGLTLTDLDGMVINMDAQALTLAENPACLATADLVLVTVKSRDTAGVATLINRHVPARIPVISLQNGVGNAATLRTALPGQDVRAGMVPFNVVPMGQGCYHRAVDGDIVIEAGPGELSKYLTTPHLACSESRDIEAVQWGKFLMNLNNALNALSGLPLQSQLKDRAWRRLMADQWAEALGILSAAGIRPVSSTPVSPATIPWVLRLPTPIFTRVAARMLRIDPQARTSMSYDLMENRPTEIDALQGEVVRMADAQGVSAPINTMVMDVIQTAELAREGLPNLTPSVLRNELKRMVGSN